MIGFVMYLSCDRDKPEFPIWSLMQENIPNTKVHGANRGAHLGQDPDGPHVGPITFAIWDAFQLILRTGMLDHSIQRCPIWHSLCVAFHLRNWKVIKSLPLKYIITDYSDAIGWFKSKPILTWKIAIRLYWILVRRLASPNGRAKCNKRFCVSQQILRRSVQLENTYATAYTKPLHVRSGLFSINGSAWS